MKTVEAAGSETIEEDGMKIIKIRGRDCGFWRFC